MLCAGLGVLAGALRFYQLGATPFNSAEANAALSAWQLASGGGEMTVDSSLPVSPLMHTLQAFTFWVSGSANPALGRFWSALAGSVVVFGPLLLRRRIGDDAALVAVFLLAVSPVMLAVSRNGDGLTLAMLCGLIMAAGWEWFIVHTDRRALTLAAAAFGAGLAAGPQFVTVLFLFMVAFLVRPKVLRGFWVRLVPELPTLAVPAVLTFILCATAMLRYPLGLSAAGESWHTWFSNWITVEGNRPVLLIPTLAVLHEPLALVLGLAGGYNAMRSRLPIKGLLGVTGVGLLFAVAYGGRQSSDVTWMVVPLTLLASLLVVAAWRGARMASKIANVGVQVGGLMMLGGFGYVQLSGLAAGRSAEWLWGRWEAVLMLATLIIVGLLAVLLFAKVWSGSIAWRGAVTAVFITLLGWSAHSWVLLVNVRPEAGLDLWYRDKPSSSADLMMQSLEDVSLWAVGEAREIEIAVVGDANGRIAWLLREYPNVTWARVTPRALSSPVVITTGESSVVAPGTNYFGQEFSDNVYWQGYPTDSSGLTKYFLFRRGHVRQTKMVLWVREDLKLPMVRAG